MSEDNASTPNQREEIKANRDDHTRNLVRVTADGMKTKQQFAFRRMNHRELRALKNVMSNSLVKAKERKYRITYWNDEDLEYKTGDFYIPDITYVRDIIDEETNTLWYQPFTMQIIEY